MTQERLIVWEEDVRHPMAIHAVSFASHSAFPELEVRWDCHSLRAMIFTYGALLPVFHEGNFPYGHIMCASSAFKYVMRQYFTHFESLGLRILPKYDAGSHSVNLVGQEPPWWILPKSFPYLVRTRVCPGK